MYGSILLFCLVCAVQFISTSATITESNTTTSLGASGCYATIARRLEVTCTAFTDVGQAVDDLVEVSVVFNPSAVLHIA